MSIVYGIAVARYNRKATEDHPHVTKTLLRAKQLGPTVFPILFAAIMGRTFSALALRLLERSSRLDESKL